MTSDSAATAFASSVLPVPGGPYSRTPLADDVDLDELAAETAGYTGADLESVLRTASMLAVRAVAEEIDPEEAAAHADEVVVTREHVDAAVERLEATRPG